MSNNIFRLNDPNAWLCKVIAYPHALHNMKIEARNAENEIAYVVFRNAVYFSGFLSWKGLDCTLSDDQDLIQLIKHSTSRYNDFSDDELTSARYFGIYRLFTIHAQDDVNIRVICNTAWVEDLSGKKILEIL